MHIKLLGKKRGITYYFAYKSQVNLVQSDKAKAPITSVLFNLSLTCMGWRPRRPVYITVQ